MGVWGGCEVGERKGPQAVRLAPLEEVLPTTSLDRVTP